MSNYSSRQAGESPGHSASTKPLAQESPFEIVVNGKSLTTLMCSPLDLDELALGHLFTRGMIQDLANLLSMGICPDRTRIKIELDADLGQETSGLSQVIASGCGSGTGLSSEFLERHKIENSLTIELEVLQSWAREMFAAAELYRLTGGMHCAALAAVTKPVKARRVSDNCGLKHYLVVREDVGRHNAVDKVVGRGLMDGADFSRSIILSSGRIAADMILKAVAAGIPVVASRSIPTTSAYAIAEKCGISVIGRIGSPAPIRYTRPERIL
jgi:FdhD protein